MTRKLTSGLFILLAFDWICAKSLNENSIIDSECVEEGSRKMRVFLTVSSLAHTENGKTIERQLEMNWYGDKPSKDDVVALYSQNPHSTIPAIPLEAIKTNGTEEGHYRTKIQYPRMRFTVNNLTNECLGYWIVYISSHEILDTNCLRARPFWINENRKLIDRFPLREVMLPGSHDSGSYSYYSTRHDNTVERYVYAQEESIFQQLVYGERYFDIRVGYHSDDNPVYWIHHSFMRTNNTLLEVLTDVVNFVKKTRELVILDFHNFPFGIWTLSDHTKLIKYISDVLKDHMIPSHNVTSDVTIGDILKGYQRILVTYNHPYAGNDYDVWPPLCQVWGNKRELEELKYYFESFYSKHASPAYLWSSMAELTPNTFYIFTHFNSGLRELADLANRNVTRWFRDLWWKSPNIVATDYILGNNMVEVAIESNIKRKLCGTVADKQINENLSSVCSPS